jgi:hypothetical protein
MAGIKIPDLPSYGSIDTSKAKKDLLITTKNDGTYGTPSYPTNASKQLTIEELGTMLPLPLNGNQFRLYNLGQTELIANTYNIIGNPATAPTVTTFTLPTVLQNKMLVAGVGATLDPFIIEITGGYSGGSASNPITVQLTEVGDTVFFIGTDYGWQYVGSNKVTDLTGYATESYVNAKVEDTIVNGVTDKAPSQNAVYDAIAAIPTPTLATVTTAGATTTNDITVGSATVSNTTASTLAFISSAKKIISATGALLGTWFQTLTAKSTPVDADTLLTGDSENGYETKITTYTQLWTNYIKGKADATYNKIYLTSRYAKVDYATTPSLSGLLERQDRPFADLQSAYDAIVALGTTDRWLIEIVGDKTVTANLLTFTSTRGNIDFVFQGNITLSIVNSGAIAGLFKQATYSVSGNKYIFNGSLTQTTNVGLGIGLSSGSDSNCEVQFNGATTLKFPKGVTDNYGIYFSGTNNRITAKNITFDISNDSGVTPYTSSMITMTGNNCIYDFKILTVQGTHTNASSVTLISTGNGTSYNKNLTIGKLYLNHASTTLTGFSLTEASNYYDVIKVDSISTTTNSTDYTTNNSFSIFKCTGVNSLLIKSCVSALKYVDISITTLNYLRTGYYSTNGSLFNGVQFKGIWQNGTTIMTKTNTSTYNLLIYPGCIIQGGSLTTSIPIVSNYAPISIGGGAFDQYVTIRNLNIINSGVTANSTEGTPAIRYGGSVTYPIKLILDNVNIAGTLSNTNANTTWIKPAGDDTSRVCNVYGSLKTNYFGVIPTNLTVYANVRVISDLKLV